ncbi:MAG: hypothetical protein PHG87_02685 [Candidatus Omnitrophica bacterium]|nr:hypothetical protein [Candidatus Omnitrophota bacterium]
MATAGECSKKTIKKNTRGIQFKLQVDVLTALVSFLLLLFIFIVQPDNRQSLFVSKFSIDTITVLLKAFLLNWLLPFSTLAVALLTFCNIILTKEAIKVSQNTLDQMRLSDRKNTAPMLKFNLWIGEEVLGPKILDEKRPREIILWNAKADTAEQGKPHYLNLSLKNVQEHPHGVAIGVSLKFKLRFSKVEGNNEICEEVVDVRFSNMDAKEEYEQSIIKISGIPNLEAEIESIRYRDMFGQQYVIGYGVGSIVMKDGETKGFFISLSGQSPDNP